MRNACVIICHGMSIIAIRLTILNPFELILAINPKKVEFL